MFACLHVDIFKIKQNHFLVDPYIQHHVYVCMYVCMYVFIHQGWDATQTQYLNGVWPIWIQSFPSRLVAIPLHKILDGSDIYPYPYISISIYLYIYVHVGVRWYNLKQWVQKNNLCLYFLSVGLHIHIF